MCKIPQLSFQTQQKTRKKGCPVEAFATGKHGFSDHPRPGQIRLNFGSEVVHPEWVDVFPIQQGDLVSSL